MKNKILVTYATRFGTTSGVAEAIGKTLSESGAQVDILPMKDVKDIAAYQTVVAGSAINTGEWLPEAMQFLRAHQAELSHKPFAAFLVCMTLTMRNAEQYKSHVATWLGPVRALVIKTYLRYQKNIEYGQPRLGHPKGKVKFHI